ncbi:MAG TPA: MFS transporter [Candidatus Sulfomarinibacteraceae bacterium]|nr:MFS transporter [Candidatus Sulfomarinibacteraceae bacterium]
MSRRKVLFWIAVLYFAEGLPFGIAFDVWPVFFRVHGVSLAEIGFMSLLSLPWTWKMLWAPLVDRWGSRQHWITAALFVLGATTIAIVPQDPSTPSWLMWGLLLLFTTASATQDIAIDAYAVDVSTPDTIGSINGMRVSAARVALLAGGGGFVFLADFTGWTVLWLVLAGVFFGLAAVAWVSPRVPLEAAERRHSIRPVLRWALRWEMVPVVAFILLYKLGDSTLGRMVKPFWVDRGYSLAEIGAISVSLGVVLTIAGALVGGWFTNRFGIFRALLWLGLAQLVSNLGYVAVAAVELPRESIYAASMVESFTQGLGTAAFLSFLMNLCDKEHAASQYAILSALFALTRDLGGALSGIGVEVLGYAAYFAVTTAAAVPGLALLPLVRPRIREGERKAAG